MPVWKNDPKATCNRPCQLQSIDVWDRKRSLGFGNHACLTLGVFYIYFSWRTPPPVDCQEVDQCE